MGVALEKLIAIILQKHDIAVADVVWPSGSRFRRGQPTAIDFAGHRTREKSLQRMAPLSETVSRAGSDARRCGHTTTPLPRWHPADLASTVRSRRSLHHMPRRIEGGQPRRCRHATVS